MADERVPVPQLFRSLRLLLKEQGVIRSTVPFPIKEEPGRPHHGSCCYCQKCWNFTDECVCDTNEILAVISDLEKHVLEKGVRIDEPAPETT